MRPRALLTLHDHPGDRAIDFAHNSFLDGFRCSTIFTGFGDNWTPPRGRRPNAPLAWLLDRGTKLGVADVEIARALAREGFEPLGSGPALVEPISDEGDESDEADAQALADAQADLVERWVAIIKSSRTRARKRPHRS